MKILVTGGAGYVGSILTPLLLSNGYKVRVLDNLMYGQSTLLSCFLNKKFEFVKGDIRNKTVVEKAMNGVDFIIHLAAIVGVPACKKDERLAREINYQGTVNLDEVRSPSQGVIFASTGSNYGSVEGVCTEETRLDPLTTYAKTKVDAEKKLIDAGNVVIYRFATGFGLSPRMRLDLMVNDFTFQAVKNGSLLVYERWYKRTFIHVRDMASSLVFALENFGQMVNDIFNVGNEELNYTKEEIVRTLRKRVNYYLHFADVGSDPDKRNYEVSYEKIRRQGFTTAISLEEGIEELINGYQMVIVKNPYSNV